jgi:hypothetical protein
MASVSYREPISETVGKQMVVTGKLRPALSSSLTCVTDVTVK